MSRTRWLLTTLHLWLYQWELACAVLSLLRRTYQVLGESFYMIDFDNKKVFHGIQKFLLYSWCNRDKSLYYFFIALYDDNICAGSHTVFLWNTNEWRKEMKISHRSLCVRCTKWVKMAEIWCFLKTGRMVLMIRLFAENVENFSNLFCGSIYWKHNRVLS